MEAAADGEPPCRTAGQGAMRAKGSEAPMGEAAADGTPAAGLGAEPGECRGPVGDAAGGGAPSRAAELGALPVVGTRPLEERRAERHEAAQMGQGLSRQKAASRWKQRLVVRHHAAQPSRGLVGDGRRGAHGGGG